MDKNIYDNLSLEEKKIFDKYKSNDDCYAYKINQILRKGEIINLYELEIQILDKIILENKSSVDLVLYRATIDINILPYINNSIYTNPEFLSTTTSTILLSHQFRGLDNPVYLEIHCSLGTHMISMESNLNFGGDEKEYLLGRNNKFKVKEGPRRITDNSEIKQIMGNLYGKDVLSLTKIRVEI